MPIHTNWIAALLVICVLLAYETVLAEPPPDQQLAPPALNDWSSPDDKYVLLNIPARNRSYYFDNSRERMCFGFTVDGLWGPTKEPGLLEATDGLRKKNVGVVLLSSAELEKYAGADLLSQAVALHLKDFENLHRRPANDSEVVPFESKYPGSIKWTGRWRVAYKGQFFLAQVVRYMAEIQPGWVAVVTASHASSGDDTARAILESLRFTTEPGCYHADISKLRQSQ